MSQSSLKYCSATCKHDDVVSSIASLVTQSVQSQNDVTTRALSSVLALKYIQKGESQEMLPLCCQQATTLKTKLCATLWYVAGTAV